VTSLKFTTDNTVAALKQQISHRLDSAIGEARRAMVTGHHNSLLFGYVISFDS